MIGMQQVHGNNVIRVDDKDDGKTIEDCDALISDNPKVTLSVRVADCLPISVTDKKSRSFGLIHAGWRGLSKAIVARTVRSMKKEFASDPKNWEVSIGPHVCQKHYEVRLDVSKKFGKYPSSLLIVDSKIYLDLAKVAELQLISLGVLKENIKISRRCTFEEVDLFSYRRDKTIDRNIYLFSLT